MNKFFKTFLSAMIVVFLSFGFMATFTYAVDGWCCKDGYVFKSTKDACLEKGGEFFLTEKEAIKHCTYEDPGWCCYKGSVYKTTPEICKEKGGDYFATEAEAKAFCEEGEIEDGWCCFEGMVFAATPEECKKKGGDYFATKAEAIKFCEEGTSGWCCLDGMVFAMTPDVCKKKGGVPFLTKPEALKYCESRTELPDLRIINIFLNKKCQVVVKVKNIGPGMVPDNVWTIHTPKSSSVYIYINGKKWGGATIWKFDPGKTLKAPGGTAIYTSTLVVKTSAKITATVDHTLQVVETNDLNNKMVKVVHCKSKRSMPERGR